MLVIGTISWNNLKFTQDFVESLKCITEPFHLLIWDNGSTDGTLDYLRALKREHLLVLYSFSSQQYYENKMNYFNYVYNDENVGQCLPWNWMLSYFDQAEDFPKADLVFLCNNDIRFTSQFNNLPTFMREHPEYGMVCPAMLPRDTDLENLEAIAEDYCFYRDNNKIIEEGGLEGPVMGITKEAFRKVGFYDSQFQYSFEDMDMHQRMHKAGLKTAVYHKSCVWHYGGASTKNKDVGSIKDGTQIYYERFQKKHG